MSGHTLQFLTYRKEKVDLRSLFIAVSFPSVSDSDVTRKSESMTIGVMASVWGVNGFLVGLPIRRSIWPIAGEFLD